MFVPSKFDILGQVAITAVVGGLLGTFFFYIKPVERVLFTVFVILRKWETLHGASWFHEKNVPRMNIPDITNSMSLLREVFNCPMIANEKMGITGAIFFSISVLSSGKALDQIGVSIPLVLLIFLSIPTIVVALWYYLWDKMHVLTMFYNFHQRELEARHRHGRKEAVQEDKVNESQCYLWNI